MPELFRNSQLPPTVDEVATPAPADTAIDGVGPTPVPTFSFSLADEVSIELPAPATGLAPNAPAAGPQRFGKFELLEPIAAGGMGVVFKARDTNLGRVVALKVMKNSILPEAQEVARFNREVRAAAQLEHTNIIKILEFGDHRGIPYFTMELAEGNLLRWLKRHPNEPQQLAAILEKIARAVQFAHERGVVHRDLKPGNILMMADGEPRLADFGLVKLEEPSDHPTPSSCMLGTPPYMAPEQLKGARGLQKSADIWALGVILYELYTGKLPFTHEHLPQLIRLIQTATPARPRSVNKDLDAGLERIILKCLEKPAEERFTSAGDLADALTRWRRGEEVKRDRWEWVRKQGRKVRRHPKAVAAALLAALLIFAGIAGARDYLDEYRAIRPAMDRFERGEKVTLLREFGGPAWTRPLFGKVDTLTSPAAPFEISCLNRGALSLFPFPRLRAFEAEAQITLGTGLEGGEVGCFLVLASKPAATLMIGVLLSNGRPGQVRPVLLCEHAESAAAPMGPSELELARSEPLHPQRWHEVRLRVEKNKLALVVNGKCLLSATPEELAGHHQMLLRQLPANSPLASIEAEPRSLGLFAGGASASVRHLAITGTKEADKP